MTLECQCFIFFLYCSCFSGLRMVVENALYSMGKWASPLWPGHLRLRTPPPPPPHLWRSVVGDGVPSLRNPIAAPWNQTYCCTAWDVPGAPSEISHNGWGRSGLGETARAFVALPFSQLWWLPDLSCLASGSPHLSLGLTVACLCYLLLQFSGL